MKIYDITADVSENMPIYGSDPRLRIEETYSMSAGGKCNLSTLTMGSHTGTHIDVPKHFIDDGETCDVFPISKFYGEAKLFDLRPWLEEQKAILPSDLEPLDICENDIVLFNTGNSPLMRDSVFCRDYRFLSTEAAAYLVDKKIKTVGIDYLSVGAGSSNGDTHRTLLGAGIGVVEGLLLDGKPEPRQGRYTLSALPLKIVNGNGSPVRAVLIDERKPELAIFDMDGLMLDTEALSVRAWEEAGKKMGFHFPPEIFDRLFGCGVTDCKKRLTDFFGESFDFDKVYALRTELVDEYIAQQGIPVKPGLIELLDFLDERGIKKCVATSTSRKRAEHCLSITQLLGRFETILCGDQIKRGKPEPEIFLTAAASMGVKPENCVVFEDSPNGVAAAYAAGMRTVLVPDLATIDRTTFGRVYARCGDLLEAVTVIREWMQ